MIKWFQIIIDTLMKMDFAQSQRLCIYKQIQKGDFLPILSFRGDDIKNIKRFTLITWFLKGSVEYQFSVTLLIHLHSSSLQRLSSHMSSIAHIHTCCHLCNHVDRYYKHLIMMTMVLFDGIHWISCCILCPSIL